MAGGSAKKTFSSLWRSRPTGGTVSRAAITLIVFAVFPVLRFLDPYPVERLRDSAIGGAIEMAGQVARRKSSAARGKVVVVDINEETIAKFGRWPLPREALGQLTGSVRAAAPACIGFAYVFTGNLRGRDNEADRALADSLRGGKVVLGTAELKSSHVFPSGHFASPPVRIDDEGLLDALPVFRRLMSVPKLFAGAAAGVGLLSIQLSHSGIPRRMPMLVRHENGVLPSLPLEMLRAGLGADAYDVSGGVFGVRTISVGARAMATDPNGMVWFGIDQDAPIRRVSAGDILSGKSDLAALRGAYVLIGSAAAGLSSEYLSTDGGLLSGLDALAYSLVALLNGQTYHYPALSLLLEVLIALLIAAFAFVTCNALNWKIFLGLGFAVLIGLWVGIVLAIARTGQILDPGLLSAFTAVLYGALLFNTYRLMQGDARSTIAEKEQEVSVLRQDSARIAVAAANPRLSIALSHELRQPLVAAHNYLGAIRRLVGRDGNEKADQLTSYADEASRQISSMSEIMRELSEIVRGDLTLQEEDDLAGLLLDAITQTVSSLGGDDVRIVTDIPGEVPPVLLNRRQIELVVSNFARNAMEAPRKTQELRLVLRVRIPEDGWVEVSVEDNASGIPDSIRGRIFSRFESSKESGSGIGLALCRDIVEAHGGRIWFDSSPESGTTFYFTLRQSIVGVN